MAERTSFRALIALTLLIAPCLAARAQECVPAETAGEANESMPCSLEISAYDTIVVGEFTDRATENTRFRGDTPQETEEARAAYEADLAIVLQNFRELLIQELQRTNVYTEVVPAGTETAGRALLIDGEVTQFDRGNFATRLFVGLGAGRVRFDTTFRLRDAATGAEISTIDMGRGSGILGGAVGTIVTVEYYLQRSAMKLASDLREERCAVIVCEEPAPLTIVASEDASTAAKEFDTQTDACRVYFYVSLPRTTDQSRGVEVWLNDDDAGVMDTEDGFFLWSLGPGDYQVSTRYLSENLRRSIDFECEQGDVLFLHHEVSGPMIERLTIEEERQGQRDVRRRQLLLAP
jgi:hypothetical protein